MSSSKDGFITDRIILNYLQKRGFKNTESTLKHEAKIKDVPNQNSNDLKLLENNNLKNEEQNNLITNFVLFYNEDEVNNPKAYDNSYSKLLKWVDDSIDIYKLELRRILFPIFVHAFLDLIGKDLKENAIHFFETYKSDHMEEHSKDITRLATITDPAHLKDNELALNFRQNKYGIIMSKYSFELLLCFLQDNKFMLLLRLMNQYSTIQVTSDKPGNHDINESGMGLIGTDSSLSTFNQQAVKLGQVPKDKEFYGDIERALANQIHSDGDELLAEVKEEIARPLNDNSPAFDSVPFPPKKLSDIASEINALRDARACIELGDQTLPSICCYTFHNTSDNLNCLKASSNADFIAGGFSDGFVKLWSVQSAKPDVPAPPPTNLIGHSGAIFGIDFSPDGDYLITGSEDKTVRLWSTDTKTNLVCYKGHNYPVFDVSFSPQGYYFATASFDKTARLWSVDHLFPLRIFVGHLSDVDTVRFHPNCNYLVTGSSDHTCRMWDVQNGNCVRIFSKHNGPVTALAVSPEGKTMASAGTDHIIKLWDLGSGNLIKSMSGHESFISSLEFSRNGEMLVSGGDDDSVRLWSVKEAETKPIITTTGFSGVDITTSTKKHGGEALIKTFHTKRTPVYSVSFTRRNVLVALGVYEKI